MSDKASTHNLALMVPTRNRAELLTKLLDSLAKGTRKPHQIVICDGSDQPLGKERFESFDLPITYKHVSPPSLTRQRNAAIQCLDSEVTLAGYLDDDIEVMEDAVEKLLAFWDTADETAGGCSFNIVNNDYLKPSLPYRLFRMRDKQEGRILPSGFSTVVFPKGKDIKAEWLCGGATVWRRKIVDQWKYDEWFSGTAYYEDMDFSYAVGKQHQLFVLNDAKVLHNPPPFVAKRGVKLGEMNVTYRHYFVKKHFGRTFPVFYWSTIGQILQNSLAAITKADSHFLFRAIGNLTGIAKVLFGGKKQITGSFRQG